MNRDCFWLTEDQFSRLAPLLPTDTRGKPRVDDRRYARAVEVAFLAATRVGMHLAAVCESND